jgi:redox-sensing transcriptional repressor
METDFGTLHIYSIDKLDSFLNEHQVDIAVLTLSQSAARPTARRLAERGIRGIWNFTNLELNLDDPNVVVENVHFADSLLALNYMIFE